MKIDEKIWFLGQNWNFSFNWENALHKSHNLNSNKIKNSIQNKAKILLLSLFLSHWWSIASSNINIENNLKLSPIDKNEISINMSGKNSFNVDEWAYTIGTEIDENKSLEASVSNDTSGNSLGVNSENRRRLTKGWWVFEWPSGMETWYDLKMKHVVEIMRDLGFSKGKYKHWIRNDGVKMLGNYVMVAANLKKRPKWTIVKTSLGMWIVCDYCERAYQRGKEKLLDVAVDWKHERYKREWGKKVFNY